MSENSAEPQFKFLRSVWRVAPRRERSRRRPWRPLLASIVPTLLVTLIGCSSRPLDPSATQLFTRLCAESGWKIHQTADDARGYYFAGWFSKNSERFDECENLIFTVDRDICITAILVHGFEYVEAEITKLEGKHLTALVETPGLYRFNLEDTGHPNCRIFENAMKNYRKLSGSKGLNYEIFKNKLTDKCIATQSISQIEAPYKIIMRDKTVYNEEKNVENKPYKRVVNEIWSSTVEISEIKTGTLLAEYRQYFFWLDAVHDSVFSRCPLQLEGIGGDLRKVLRSGT